MSDIVEKITSLLPWRSFSLSLEPKLKHMEKAANVHYKITKRLYILKNMLRHLEAGISAKEPLVCHELRTCVKDMYFCAEVLLRIHLRGVNGNRDGEYWYDPIRAWRRKEEHGEKVSEDEKTALRALLAFWVDENGRRKEYDFLPGLKQVEFGGLQEMSDCYQKLLRKLWQNGDEIGWKGFEAERTELMNREDTQKHVNVLMTRPAIIVEVSR